MCFILRVHYLVLEINGCKFNINTIRAHASIAAHIELTYSNSYYLALRIYGLPFQQEWYNETYCTATWYQTNRDGEGKPSFSNATLLFQKCLKITD